MNCSCVVHAIVLLMVILVLASCLKLKKCPHADRFSNPEKVYKVSAAEFNKTNGEAPYSTIKNACTDVTPVDYADLRNLWKNNNLTLETVAAI